MEGRIVRWKETIRTGRSMDGWMDGKANDRMQGSKMDE
jgi:hypothetical protein